MNREELADLEGTVTRWRGTVSRFSADPAGKRVVCLVNLTAVRLGGILLDHVWINCGAWCKDLKPGYLVYFDAGVYSYVKGNTQNAWRPELLPVKYGLCNPENVLISKARNL